MSPGPETLLPKLCTMEPATLKESRTHPASSSSRWLPKFDKRAETMDLPKIGEYVKTWQGLPNKGPSLPSSRNLQHHSTRPNPAWRILGLSTYGYKYLNWGYKPLQVQLH